MPMTRIARTHLVYQFIILTLVFLGFCYYELLLERRFVMFLFFVPTFLYQLVILSCCADLIPVPRWMKLTEVIDKEDEEQTTGSMELGEDVGSEENAETPLATPEKPMDLNNVKRDIKARIYKFRNWKAVSPNHENSEEQSLSVSVNASSITLPEKQGEFTLRPNDSDHLQGSELTKSYFFPHRQKRLEQWIESKENQRPYKIRNWESSAHDNKSELDSIPTSNTSEVLSTEKSDFSEPDCFPLPESDLPKRYTFPFRRKQVEQWVESKDNIMEDYPNRPSTPYWHTVGYSVAVKQEARRRRRSVSSSLLKVERLDFDKESERCKDFSQSVEISTSNTGIAGTEGNVFRASTTTFSKMKQGISNCLSKIKKDNSKNIFGKEEGNKRRTFKSFFQSRENIHLEPSEGEQKPNSKAKSEESTSRFYPAYIPFESDRFENDVRKRMLELPRA